MTPAYRELYCPAHFGNSYEVMWPGEMREVLAEAQAWGFNAYGDWFDSADLKAPWEGSPGEYLLPQALWERKLAHFRTAASLGLALDLVVTPNHVFLNQLRPDLLADSSPQRFFGQLLCPSKPEAREIILGNYRRIFADLAAQNIALDSLSGCPFDYGGCACAACEPWIVTFGQLFVELHKLARMFFPQVQARLIGWWWTKEEHTLFQRWADAEQPGRFLSLAAHIPYGEIAPAEGLALPDGCERHAFIHIGYGDKAQPRDVYGPWGPVVAATRIPATVAALASSGYTGYMAYSEGVFDDVNKALLGGLSSGMFSDAASLLAAYAERYLGAKGAERESWAAWIAQWSDPFAVNTAAARQEYERLARGAPQSWRLAQLEAKLALFEAHNAVRENPFWDKERMAAAERFFATRERLQRGIWGLGLVRHVLADCRWPPDWLDDWKAQRRARYSFAAGPSLPEV